MGILCNGAKLLEAVRKPSFFLRLGRTNKVLFACAISLNSLDGVLRSDCPRTGVKACFTATVCAYFTMLPASGCRPVWPAMVLS